MRNCAPPAQATTSRRGASRPWSSTIRKRSPATCVGSVKRTCRPRSRPACPAAARCRGELWHDLRYAARALRKQPGFAAVAILTLALGIGANSAIFALVDATLLRPLPFGNPDRLVMLSERSATSARGAVSPLNMTDWNERNRTFDVIAGYVPSVGGMVMTGADGLAENVNRQWVTSGFFDALGIQPIAGRTFAPRRRRPAARTSPC